MIPYNLNSNTNDRQTAEFLLAVLAKNSSGLPEKKNKYFKQKFDIMRHFCQKRCPLMQDKTIKSYKDIKGKIQNQRTSFHSNERQTNNLKLNIQVCATANIL